jgi:hypothetical protein
MVVSRQVTVHGRLSTVDYGLSTINRRLWTINYRLSTIIFLLVFASGCANINYSFTGAAISPEVKSVSIQNFYNDSGGGPPVMSQQFTESLKDYYQQNTNLALVDEDGDLQLEGAIVRYDFEPVAPQSSGSDQVADVAAEMRLTITVEATYINTYDDQYDFDGKTFSFFADFPADQDPTAVEDDLVEEILDQIIFDIFTATVANW